MPHVDHAPTSITTGNLILYFFLFKDKLGFYFKPFTDEAQEIEVKEKSTRRRQKLLVP